MRICVPSAGPGGPKDQIGQHFGRVQNYTIFDTQSDKYMVLPNTSNHMGGTGLPPELLKKNDVDVMLVSGIGRRAIQLFQEFGIDVFIGASGTVEEALKAYKNDQLTAATDKDGCVH